MQAGAAKLIILSIIAISTVIAVLGCAWLLHDGSSPSSKRIADTNATGDETGGQTYTYSVSTESPLASEIRRLGMDASGTLRWFSPGASEKQPTKPKIGPYLVSTKVLLDCDHLVLILEKTNTPDEDRRIVIERLLAYLRTMPPTDADFKVLQLIDEVAEKRGIEVFEPTFRDELRELRDDEKKAEDKEANGVTY